jgi:hypothetical protein
MSIPPGLDENAFVSRQWTQQEIDLLHDMIRDYDRARWLRGQFKWWAIWVLGLPTGLVSIWKAIEQIVATVKGFR